MRSRLLNLLRCPLCQGTFRATAFERAVVHGEEAVSDGLLSCSCGTTYPIIRGIPRLLENAPKLFQEFYGRYRDELRDNPMVACNKDNPSEERAIEKTRESFGYQWTHFSEMALDFRQNFLNYIAPVNESFFPGKLGIDVGCGFGRHIYNAATFGAEMVGLDISDAIESTRKNTKHFPNVHLVQADVYHPPFSAGTFDFAYSIGVLHHLPDPEDAFRHVISLVRPGGAAFIWVYSNRRRVVNFVLESVRAVTTRMPPQLQHGISFAAAAVDWVCFIKPCSLLMHLFAGRSENFPLQRLSLYSKYPFQVVWADWFDRLAAPIRFYYDGQDLNGWLRRASLSRTAVSPTGLFGWRAYGERL
jgi:SAM-dependent methyltransferase